MQSPPYGWSGLAPLDAWAWQTVGAGPFSEHQRLPKGTNYLKPCLVLGIGSDAPSPQSVLTALMPSRPGCVVVFRGFLFAPEFEVRVETAPDQRSAGGEEKGATLAL